MLLIIITSLLSVTMLLYGIFTVSSIQLCRFVIFEFQQLIRSIKTSTNCCAFEKLSAFRCANPGAHSIFAVTLPFASAEVNTLPRGVVIRNSFFCAIYSPSILQCGNPPNRLSDQDNTLQCLNRTSFRSAGLSIS